MLSIYHGSGIPTIFLSFGRAKSRSYRKFLGSLVTQRGIEANPEQIRALSEMPSPRPSRVGYGRNPRRGMRGSLGRKAHKAISQGYFWPYMQADARRYVRKCDKCQRHSKMIHSPSDAEELHPISSPWPFAMWGDGHSGTSSQSNRRSGIFTGSHRLFH